MPFEVRHSTRASRDLIRILDDLGGRDPDWAVAVHEAISDKLESLAQNPFLSSIVRQISSGEVREVLAGSYRIFFIVNEPDQVVRVMAIRHVRQQDPEFPE